jgi:hypothetical protein
MSNTPGPWSANWTEDNQRTHIGHWYFRSEKKTVLPRCTEQDAEQEANARLMAAAPELLEHAKRLAALLPNVPLVIAGTARTDKWINDVWNTLRKIGCNTNDVHDRLPREEVG